MIISLDKLPIGKIGKIYSLNCNGDIRRRFLDLGIVNNTKVTPVLQSPSGDPRAFEIRGCLIAIRSEDANLINVFL